MTTGQRIKAARKRAQMTQAELAEKLNIPFQSVSQWERDIRNPKYETLRKIADALNEATEEARKISGESEITWEDLYSGSQEERLVLMAQGILEKLPEAIKTNKEREKKRQEMPEKCSRLETDEDRITYFYSKLNAEGRRVAADRVQELSEIPKYREEPEVK